MQKEVKTQPTEKTPEARKELITRRVLLNMLEDLSEAKMELEKKIRDLETFQRITMDREKRIIELKKEIKELKKQLEVK